MRATNHYEQPPAWGQTKATDLPCQPWASLDLSAWQCRAGPSWLQSSEGCPRELLLNGQRAGGLGFPCSTLPQLTLPEPCPSSRVTVSGRSLRVGGCAEEIVGKAVVGTS